MCRYKLGDFAKAKQAFETTYKDFPNAPGDGSKNHYHAHALFQWARCEQALGNFESATKLFLKFVEESPPAEREAARAAIRRAKAAATPPTAPPEDAS